MDKIQIIEKLFQYLLEYSYLLLPLSFLFTKHKKDKLLIVLCLYGIVFFLFLHYFYLIPANFRKLQQTTYTLLEFIFFSFVFLNIIENKRIKKIIFISSTIFIVFQVLFYFTSDLQKIDSIPIGIETIIIFFFVFLYFQQYFKNNLTENIYEYPSFWLVVAIIIYLASSFFFNILANHVTQKQIDDYWHFTFIPEIFKNVIFALVILGIFFNKNAKTQIKTKDIPNLDMI